MLGNMDILCLLQRASEVQSEEEEERERDVERGNSPALSYEYLVDVVAVVFKEHLESAYGLAQQKVEHLRVCFLRRRRWKMREGRRRRRKRKKKRKKSKGKKEDSSPTSLVFPLQRRCPMNSLSSQMNLQQRRHRYRQIMKIMMRRIEKSCTVFDRSPLLLRKE